MMGYGTGAIMAVPAHDERDFDFAVKFGIDILPVIKRNDGLSKTIVSMCQVTEDYEEYLKKIKVDYKIDNGRYDIIVPESIVDEFIDYTIKSMTVVESACPIVGTRWGFIGSDKFHKWNSFETGKEYLDILKCYNPNLQEKTLMEYFNNIPFFKDILFHAEKGKIINSYSEVEIFEGEIAKTEVTKWIEAKGIGKASVNYKLRDWLISRQRYWGCPIPIIHCKKCGTVPVPEKDLPVTLPDVENYIPSGSGESPLANIEEWVNVKCPCCGGNAKRETDTMGGFACSSWYFLRFISPQRNDVAFDKDLASYWLPVDLYVGGAEHAVMHLLYARFWTKVLFDEGLIPFTEPFNCLKNQGMVLSYTPHRPIVLEDGSKTSELIPIFPEEVELINPEDISYKWVKMSKSKRNVVSPDAMTEEFGADSLRIYELFVAPFEDAIQWSQEGMIGAFRFINRIWRLIYNYIDRYDKDWALHMDEVQSKEAKSLRRKLHQTIKKVDHDINDFKFNTGIAALMELVNEMQSFSNKIGNERTCPAISEAIYNIILMMSPITPHICDEIWKDLGYNGHTIEQNFPDFDSNIAKEEDFEIVIQILGKVKAKITVPVDISEDKMKTIALENEKIKAELIGKDIKKIITVKGKLVNIVAN